MLEIKDVEVHGLYRSINASGNPMTVGAIDTSRNLNQLGVAAGDALKRGKKLGSAHPGSGHDNFLKGIIVQFNIKYPQYWTPEAQRYHWLDIVSSQSKMHRLTTAGSKLEFHSMFNQYVDHGVIDIVQKYVELYNNSVPELSCMKDEKYYYFMKALSNLPMGYEMWESLSTNYLQLKTIYKQRKNHKLKEDWSVFCKMCEELPFFKELTGL